MHSNAFNVFKRNCNVIRSRGVILLFNVVDAKSAWKLEPYIEPVLHADVLMSFVSGVLMNVRPSVSGQKSR